MVKYLIACFTRTDNNYVCYHMAGYASYPSRTDVDSLITELATDPEFNAQDKINNTLVNVFDVEYCRAFFPQTIPLIDQMNAKWNAPIPQQVSQ